MPSQGIEAKKTLPSTLSPTNLDLAWAAGLYEGEGNVQRNKNSVSVRISQNDCWVTHRLLVLFGGTLGTQYGWKGRAMCRWMLNGARARGFLLTIYPWLSLRRQEAVRAAVHGD